LYGHVDLARFLLVGHASGADAAAQDNQGRAQLHWASWCGHVGLSRFLLVKHSTNAAAKDKCRRTPLHEASSYGHVDLTRFLVEEHGANASDKFQKPNFVLSKIQHDGSRRDTTMMRTAPHYRETHRVCFESDSVARRRLST